MSGHFCTKTNSKAASCGSSVRCGEFEPAARTAPCPRLPRARPASLPLSGLIRAAQVIVFVRCFNLQCHACAGHSLALVVKLKSMPLVFHHAEARRADVLSRYSIAKGTAASAPALGDASGW